MVPTKLLAALSATLVFAAGCSSPQQGAPPTESAEHARAGASPTVPAAAPAPGGDETSWVDADEPDPMSSLDWHNATYDQLMDVIRSRQANYAQRLLGDEVPPEVLIESVLPPREANRMHIQCLTDSGFTVSATPDGEGIEFGDRPTDQEQALRMAIYTCTSRYAVDPRHNQGDLPTDVATRLFRFWRDTTGPCFEELGYTISEPPSEQVWLSEYAAQAHYWNPLADLHAQALGDSIKIAEAHQNCPMEPPDLYPPFPSPS